MEKTEDRGKNIQMQLPVEVEYDILDQLLAEKLQGKVLSKGKENGESSDQAKIEEIHLKRNIKVGFLFSLQLKIRLLTTIFSGKEVEMLIHLTPEFDAENQEIYVEEYEIDGLNNGWIVNNLLESLVNSFMYNNLKDKMKFNLKPLIQSKLTDLNSKLSSGMEVKNGIFLFGDIRELRITKISFEEEAIIAFLDIAGRNKINIQSSILENKKPS